MGFTKRRLGHRATAIIMSEAAIAAAAAMLLAFGHPTWALVVAAGPIQLLVYFLIAQSELAIMGYLVALLPASMLELLPYGYMHVAVYAAALLLLAVVHSPAGRERAGRSDGRRGRNLDMLPVVILGVSLVVSAANARIRGWAGPDLARHCLAGLLFLGAVWVFGTRPRSTKDMRRLLDLMAACYVLAGLALPLILRGSHSGLMSKTLVSPNGLVNMNIVGAHVSAASSYLLVRAVSERGWGRRVVRLLLCVVPLGVLVLSRSRGAWLGFAVSLVYVVLTSRSLWLIVASAAATAGLVTNDIFKFAVATRVEVTGAQDPSFLGRLLLWRFGFVVGLDNWLTGVGFLNFRHVKYAYGFPWPRALGIVHHSHNLYLEFFADLGVFGLVALLVLLTRGISAAHRQRRDKQGGLRPEALGLAAMLIGLAVHGLLDVVIWQHGMLMLLAVLLGLAASLRRVGSGEMSDAEVG